MLKSVYVYFDYEGSCDVTVEVINALHFKLILLNRKIWPSAREIFLF